MCVYMCEGMIIFDVMLKMICLCLFWWNYLIDLLLIFKWYWLLLWVELILLIVLNSEFGFFMENSFIYVVIVIVIWGLFLNEGLFNKMFFLLRLILFLYFLLNWVVCVKFIILVLLCCCDLFMIMLFLKICLKWRYIIVFLIVERMKERDIV